MMDIYVTEANLLRILKFLDTPVPVFWSGGLYHMKVNADQLNHINIRDVDYLLSL